MPLDIKTETLTGQAASGAQGADQTPAGKLKRLPINDIGVANRLLDVNDANVAALKESIAQVGLISPIIVTYYPGRRQTGLTKYHLIVGLNRLTACRELGWDTIDAIVVNSDYRPGRLKEIDENLCRHGLTDAERAKLTAERKRIYELDHPEVKQGGAPGKSGGGKKARPANLASFADQTAKVTGQSKRKVERDATRAKALGPDTLAQVRGTCLDKGVELDALIKLPEEERAKLIERAAAGEKVSAIKPKQRLNQALKDVESEAGAGAETDDPAASGEQRKAENDARYGERDGVDGDDRHDKQVPTVNPLIIANEVELDGVCYGLDKWTNVLLDANGSYVDTPERLGAFLEYLFLNNRFIAALQHAPHLKAELERLRFKGVPLPENVPATKNEAIAALQVVHADTFRLIEHLRGDAVNPTPPDGAPPDPGPAPDGEPEPKVEAPAENAVAATAVAPTPPIDRSLDIPDPLIQAARQSPAPAPSSPRLAEVRA